MIARLPGCPTFFNMCHYDTNQSSQRFGGRSVRSTLIQLTRNQLSLICLHNVLAGLQQAVACTCRVSQ